MSRPPIVLHLVAALLAGRLLAHDFLCEACNAFRGLAAVRCPAGRRLLRAHLVARRQLRALKTAP